MIPLFLIALISSDRWQMSDWQKFSSSTAKLYFAGSRDSTCNIDTALNNLNRQALLHLEAATHLSELTPYVAFSKLFIVNTLGEGPPTKYYECLSLHLKKNDISLAQIAKSCPHCAISIENGLLSLNFEQGYFQKFIPKEIAAFFKLENSSNHLVDVADSTQRIPKGLDVISIALDNPPEFSAKPVHPSDLYNYYDPFARMRLMRDYLKRVVLNIGNCLECRDQEYRNFAQHYLRSGKDKQFKDSLQALDRKFSKKNAL